jgi:hypothetical protein
MDDDDDEAHRLAYRRWLDAEQAWCDEADVRLSITHAPMSRSTPSIASR